MKWLAGILILSLLAVAGAYYYFREDPLRTELDRRWAPVTAEQQRQTAIDSAGAALQTLSVPNVAAGVDTSTVQTIVFDLVKGKGVNKLIVATDRQMLRLNADFDLTLKPEDLPPDSDLHGLIAKISPHVLGRVDLFLGVAATLETSPQRALQIKLLPAIHSVKVDKLTLAGNYDVSAAGNAIALMLNRYADNLSGVIAANPLLNITLPATLQDEFDPSGPINISFKDAPDLKIALSGRPAKNPFGLVTAAWLIDNDKIVTIAQLVPVDQLKSPTYANQSPETFEVMKTAFQKKLSDALDISDPPRGVWIAVSKTVLAQSLGSAFSQAQPCPTASGSIPREKFSKKVPTPDPSSINCTPSMNCTPTRNCDLQVNTRDCRRPRNCPHNHDTRNCSACIVHNPFGGCVIRGNDPTCEIAKATQNAAYDADFAACQALGPILDGKCELEKATQNRLYEAAKLGCETEKETARLACETEKTAKRVACESGKAIVDGLHRTGNFANIDGSISGGSNLNACFRDVHFTGAMDKVTLRLDVSGSAALDTHFEFVPLDAGHVICPIKWTADKRINTNIPTQSIGINLTLARLPVSESTTYQGRVDELPVKLHFEPSPLSLVLQNINFTLACPIAAGLINGITLGLGPLIPELLKDYTYKLKPLTFSFTPKIPSQPLFGHRITPKLSESARALLVSGVPD